MRITLAGFVGIRCDAGNSRDVTIASTNQPYNGSRRAAPQAPGSALP